MNSKQRVIKALNLQEPDKIPHGEFAIDFDTVEKVLGRETYLRAKAKIQIALWEGRRDEVAQSLKEDIVEFYKKLDCLDIINLATDASGILPPKDYDPDPPKKIDHKTWEDSQGRVYRFSEITQDILIIDDPNMWKMEYSVEDFDQDKIIKKPDDSIFEVIDHVVSKLGKEKFIIGPAGEEVGMVLLGGTERGLIEYSRNPLTVKAAAQQKLKIENQKDNYYIRKGIDAIMWGQDFASTKGPFISPAMFKEFVLPYDRKRVENIRKFKIPVIKHACGNNWLLMDMFIDIGYDCYHSIQESASMDIVKLKNIYGNKLCLWGGIPCEYLTAGLNPEIKRSISRSIKRTVEYGAPGGGLIIGTSHSVAVGSNYDTFMFMLEEINILRL